MTTVINNPGDGSSGGSGMGVVVGVIIAILLIGLFVVYGWPALRGDAPSNDTLDVNIDLPNPSNDGGGAPVQ